MRNQYDKHFKEDAAKYYYEHKDSGSAKCAEKLGTSKTALTAWVLSGTLEAEHAAETIEKAERKRAVDKSEIIHAGMGMQYTCSAYQESTEGWTRIYSKKAYPRDNACTESFHALIKRERFNRFNVIGYNQAYKLIFEYIETFYNTVRIHSHCGYQSPADYEKEYLIKMEKKIKTAG